MVQQSFLVIYPNTKITLPYSKELKTVSNMNNATNLPQLHLDEHILSLYPEVDAIPISLAFACPYLSWSDQLPITKIPPNYHVSWY